MDIWKFFDITHRDHIILNPTGEEKLTQLVELLRLTQGAHVVDIASGKAEFLIRLAQRYGARCTGVDFSPHFVAQARERVAALAPEFGIELLEMDGAEYRPVKPAALASCLGASWIFGGHAGTLDALSAMVELGGWILAGEPYWIQEPTEEYLKGTEVGRNDFGSHLENARAGEDRGLELVYTIVSNADDWDRYEGLQWNAASAYALEHPDDPDVPELTSRLATQKEMYLKWGRVTLGWAIYVFRKRAG